MITSRDTNGYFPRLAGSASDQSRWLTHKAFRCSELTRGGAGSTIASRLGSFTEQAERNDRDAVGSSIGILAGSHHDEIRHVLARAISEPV